MAKLNKKVQQNDADRDGAHQVCSSPAGNNQTADFTVTLVVSRQLAYNKCAYFS